MSKRVEPKPGELGWWQEARFGMFIHWGTYAGAARIEWVQSNEEIAGEQYQRYFEHFEADLFDPAEWARRAREAGMKYLVITAKHHEGFSLWDTAFSEFKATNAPCGRDLLKEVVEAFRAEGLRIGFYYSLIDWHHPDFTIDAIHPLRNHPEAAKMNETRDMERYREFMKNQVRELLTQFGPIDILWFDFSYPWQPYQGQPGKGREDWDSEGLYALVKELQPSIVINNRLDLPAEFTEFVTPEQVTPEKELTFEGKPVAWEACQTLCYSWGYARDEFTYKSPEQLIKMLIDMVSNGGNLLMNVGPTSRGTLDPRAQAALAVYGEWMRLHGRAIYGCGRSEFETPRDCRLTQRGDRLYVHVYSWPFVRLFLNGLAGKVEYAQLMHDGSEVRFQEGPWGDPHGNMDLVGREDLLTLELPIVKPEVTVPVVELFLKS